MIKDIPRLVLVKLAVAHDVSLIEDARRLEGILNEYCGQYHQEVGALVAAIRYGIVAELVKQAPQTHEIGLYERLANSLQRSTGLTKFLAYWTIMSWVEALRTVGIIMDGVVEPPGVITEPASALLQNTEMEHLPVLPPPLFSPTNTPKQPLIYLSAPKTAAGAVQNPKPEPKPPKFEEKRRVERRHMTYYLRVIDRRRRRRIIGHLMDANMQGIMLISENPIQTNIIFQMRMTFPQKTRMVNVDFDARSLWNRRDVMPGYFNTGFKLIKISKDDLKQIEEAVRLYGLKAAGD